MITVTDWRQFIDSTAMTISVGYYRDRSGRVSEQYVEVDEEVTFAPVESLTEDVAVNRARDWLLR